MQKQGVPPWGEDLAQLRSLLVPQVRGRTSGDCMPLRARSGELRRGPQFRASRPRFTLRGISTGTWAVDTFLAPPWDSHPVLT